MSNVSGRRSSSDVDNDREKTSEDADIAFLSIYDAVVNPTSDLADLKLDDDSNTSLNETQRPDSLSNEDELVDNYRLRPSTSNAHKFKLDERAFDERELEAEERRSSISQSLGPRNFAKRASIISALGFGTSEIAAAAARLGAPHVKEAVSATTQAEINEAADYLGAAADNNIVGVDSKGDDKDNQLNRTTAIGTAVSTDVADTDVDEENEFADDSLIPIEQNEEWQRKSKHIFVLSEAGKPIYTLHGNEVQLITFMGLLQALVSIIECDNQNALRHVVAGDHKFVFAHKSHLILVCVSAERDLCVEQLELELNYVYNQIVSVCTLSLIDKIFSRHHNYDLRNKLTGTEKLLTNIVRRCTADYGMLLNCVNSYPLQAETRDQVSRIVAQHINPYRYVIFGLLLCDNRLVSLIRPKSRNIHPVDVHLLVNVITGLDTPKSAEFTWYPICLPYFDANGIMYAYISHLDEACNTCLILLTGLCDQDQSLELNECRKRIQQRLQAQSIIQLMNSKGRDAALRLDQIGVPELRHFVFKDNKIFQYFASDFAPPINGNAAEQQRLFNVYQQLYHRLHNTTNALRIVYRQQQYETVLGWMTSNFEIYVTFSPLVTKEITIRAINKLLEFTQKNKTKIFLNAMPTLQR